MEKWNTNESLKDSHNCFAYAIDTVDAKLINDCKETAGCEVGFPQPGYDSGYKEFSKQKEKGCADMVMRMWGDNPKVSTTKFTSRCQAGTSKIALIVDPKRDYHFLRQDPDGYWSHKPGSLPVKRVDASDRPILRPDRALFVYKDAKDPLIYSDFCGYFCVPRGKALDMSKIVKKGGSAIGNGGVASSPESTYTQPSFRYRQTRRKR